jgi:hypothetical protein
MARMKKARAARLEWRWIRYIERCTKLNAYPISPSWERDYGQEVALEYNGSYRKVRR